MSGETTIRAQEVKVIQDRTNASKETADKAKLKMERLKLQTDLLAVLTARISVRQTDYNTIVTDGSKLVAAIGSGSHATTALQTAVTKFINDKTASHKVLLADITKLGTDRTKITADLTAE